MATTRPVSSPYISPPTQIWLVNAWTDAAGVLGGGVVFSLCFYVAWKTNPTTFVIAASLFAMFSDMPHVLQTPVRILLDPQERALHGKHYVISLAVIATMVATLLLTGHLITLLAIWVGWQFLHVIKQHYGIIAIYAAKAKYRSDKKLIKYALIVGCVAPFLYRLRNGMVFADYILFGHRMPFSGLALPVPPVPRVLVFLAYALFAGLFVSVAIEQLRIARGGSTILPPMALATFLTAVISYNVSYILVSDLYALILIATSVHSLQYHLISWRRNHGRFALGLQPENDRLFLARISRRDHLWLYSLFFLFIGFLAANGEMILLGGIPVTLVIHHFYLDGFVWKAKGNPRLPFDLGLAGNKS